MLAGSIDFSAVRQLSNDVHLANVPRHVRRRPRDLKTLLKATPVDGVDVVDPDRHPRSLVSSIVTFWPDRLLESALAPTALGVLTQEDLALARANAPKVGGSAPIPRLLPPELLEPKRSSAEYPIRLGSASAAWRACPCPPIQDVSLTFPCVSSSLRERVQLSPVRLHIRVRLTLAMSRAPRRQYHGHKVRRLHRMLGSK